MSQPIDLKKVMVIVPTYNERYNIPLLIEEIFTVVPEVSLLIVDDNSPDGTSEAVIQLSQRHPRLLLLKRLRDRGLGRSYIDGFRKVLQEFTDYQAIIMMDADFSHNPREIPVMVAKLSDCDVVLGSRYISGGRIVNWNFRRRLLSQWASFYTRTILSMPFRDMTNGSLAFRTDVLKKITLDEIRSNGYSFIVELKYRLARNSCQMREHPITLTERREGHSKMSSRVVVEAVLMPWKLRFLTSKSSNK